MIKINKVRHKNPDLPPYIGYNPKASKPYYYKRQSKEGYFQIGFKTLEEAIAFKDNHVKKYGDRNLKYQAEVIKQYKLKNNVNNYIPQERNEIQKCKEIVLKNGDIWNFYWLETIT